jgi:hypothetical protein
VRRRLIVLGAGLAGAALAVPATASAHGLVGKQDLPIPEWLFAWGAAVVLVASFVALAALWTSPRLQELRERPVWRVPRILDVLCGLIGVAAFVFIVYAGLAGSQTALENIVPTFVYVPFWVAIPFISFWAGDVFRAFNPWRAVARFAAWAAGRMGGASALPAPLEYPRRLGRWPAMVGILFFAWVELVLPPGQRDDPSTLAIMGLAYAAVQLVGMSLYGIDPWLRNADPFGVYFGMFARLAPLHWKDGRLFVRRPLSGVVQLETRPGTVALVTTMIGTTSFDGFSQGKVWTSIAPHLQQWFIDLGFTAQTSVDIAFTIGLLAMVAIISAFYRVGVIGMASVGEGHDAAELSRRFAHTLVPIALAYLVAHYFSLVGYQGQAMFYLVSDPLGHGTDYLGTAGVAIDYGWVSATGIWYVQVAALVIGHVCGLVLAHDRALSLYRDPRAATRSQYWMLVVMVGFTSLGLWILSAASQ